MNVLLVNIDSEFNIAIRKLYKHYNIPGNYVEMINIGMDGYPSNRYEYISGLGFDKVFVSNIFDVNMNKYEVVGCEDVTIGGIGSINPSMKLPPEIDELEPFYFDYEDTSYESVTRGCIRNCYFCKVPKYEGKLVFKNTVEKVVGKHRKAKFLDNNILAYEKHMDVFEYLIGHDIRCDFNQGLDFRLANHENTEMLSRLNYNGDYIFAFDDPKYQPLLEKKLEILKTYISQDWKLKFYIYHNKNMPVEQLISRVEWCRSNKCKPYVMRDINCWEDNNNPFFIDYAAYCNQPEMFKKMSFEEFMEGTRHPNNPQRVDKVLKIYNKHKGGIV